MANEQGYTGPPFLTTNLEAGFVSQEKENSGLTLQGEPFRTQSPHTIQQLSGGGLVMENPKNFALA